MEKLMKQLLQEKVCALTERSFIDIINFKVNGMLTVTDPDCFFNNKNSQFSSPFKKPNCAFHGRSLWLSSNACVRAWFECCLTQSFVLSQLFKTCVNLFHFATSNR